MASGVLCLLLVGQTDSVPLLTAHAVCFGLAVGGTEVFWITVLRRRLPEGAFSRAWGIWYFLELAVLVAAPAAAGLLYDISGNYVTALRWELALLLVPLVLSVRLAAQESHG
jgi:hypothetical protein